VRDRGSMMGVPGSGRLAFFPIPAAGLAFVASLLGAIACPAHAEGHWYPFVGADWTLPLASAVRDVYSSGPGAAAGIGFSLPESTIPKAELAIEIRGDWFRKVGHPSTLLAQSTDSRITITPFALEVRLAPRTHGARPFVAAGGAVIWSREVFHYTMFGETTSLTGTRTNGGAVLAAGVEIPAGEVNLRLGARGIVSGGHRKVLRTVGDAIDVNQTDAPSSISAVLEVAL
jgi:hypothetical protein